MEELLRLLRQAALKGSPDNPSYRVARAMECEFCDVSTRLVD